MPKKPMVTRTVTTTMASIMLADTERAKFYNVEVNLPRTYKDDDAILKAARPLVETKPHLKAVSVAHSETCEGLYGMSEAEFLQHAKLLPPRGTKSDAELEPAEVVADETDGQ